MASHVRSHVEHHRMRVLERELHHDPVVAPDQREDRERDVGAAPRVHEEALVPGASRAQERFDERRDALRLVVMHHVAGVGNRDEPPVGHVREAPRHFGAPHRRRPRATSRCAIPRRPPRAPAPRSRARPRTCRPSGTWSGTEACASDRRAAARCRRAAPPPSAARGTPRVRATGGGCSSAGGRRPRPCRGRSRSRRAPRARRATCAACPAPAPAPARERRSRPARSRARRRARARARMRERDVARRGCARRRRSASPGASARASASRSAT